MMTRTAAMNCLAGGGEMGALMRAYDWSQSPVGPVNEWPQSLKTSVSTCLNSRFAVVLWWSPALVTFYNDAYMQIIGRKHPRALGAPAWELWPEIWQIIEPMLKGVMERGDATWADDMLLELHRNGYPEECYFTFSYSPIRDESGNVGGVFTPVQETTERVIGERRLRTLSDLASGARAANAQTVAEVCRVAMETLARNPFDVPFAALYLDEQTAGAAGVRADAEIVRLLAKADEGVAALSADEIPCGAWPVPPTEAIVLPILPGGQRAGRLAAAVSPRKRLDPAYRDFFQMIAGHIATAVAEARAAEDERRRAETLAELDRAKTVFFSNISHEFRTPLMLMLGPIEDALEDGRPDRERLEAVMRNGQRLRKLVDNLLDFSRIEAGRIEASYEPVDLAGATAELASTFRSAVEKAGLRLTVDCPDLGEAVYVDRGMWEKIVLNLLSNAFKYTPAGAIEVCLRRVRGNAELTVRDTGIGIPEAHLARVFDRFYRVEGARGRSVEGSGIGLSLVQELVRLHGGTVRAESEPGRGSTFTVSIPMGAAHLPAPRVRRSGRGDTNAYADEAARWVAAEPMAQADAAPGARARVLLADDNADMRAYIARLLGPAYQVSAVADGREALARIRENPPDLVLTDVMMAEMDGFELLRAVRADARTKALPVIVLSARAGEEARLEGLAHGADDYLTKPFTARELLGRVEARLELARVQREAVRMLETVMENTPAGIALLSGGEYRFEWLNAAYRALAPEREMLGRTLAEVWPEAVGELRPLVDRVMETGEAFVAHDAAFRVQWSAGGPIETRYFNYALAAVDLPGGRGRGVLATCVETTALRASNQKLERVLASITDGYYTLDADWRFVAMNPVAARNLGVAPADVIGRDFWQVTKLAPDCPAYERMSRAMESRTPTQFEDESRLRPGAWAEVHLHPRDEGGLEVYFRDITDRKRSEQAMKESEERFRRLFDANIVGIICADEEKIYEANDAFLAMMGVSREEFTASGMAWRALTPSEHLARDEEAIAEMLVNGSFQPFEKEYFRSDRTRIPVLLGGSLLQKSPMQCICFILDLTERKQLERRVLEAQKLESLGVLAGGMAHDFNNLLVGVMGNASLAKEMLADSHPASELLDSVLIASDHAALLTKQMLAYSGKGRFVMEPVNLSELVEEIVPIVQPSISKKIGLRIELANLLPSVEADRSQMQQILTNLLLNASEAIGEASGTIAVRTEARVVEGQEMGLIGELVPGSYVCLEVEDTGCGMDETTRRRIFDPFFSTKFTGRGLGLAAVAGIVRGHQGAIRVRSAPGRGSRFSVFLPATPQASRPPAPAADPVEELRGSGTILVVDDEAVVRSMATRALERYGYQVRLAESGPEAVETVRAGGIDAVLLDLSMPGMSGQETLVEMRKVDGRVPVLLSSGYNEAETMQLFEGMDVSGFIQKPYRGPQLAKKIKGVLGESRR